MPRKLTPQEVDQIVAQVRAQIDAYGAPRLQGTPQGMPSSQYQTMISTSDAEDELAVSLTLT